MAYCPSTEISLVFLIANIACITVNRIGNHSFSTNSHANGSFEEKILPRWWIRPVWQPATSVSLFFRISPWHGMHGFGENEMEYFGRYEPHSATPLLIQCRRPPWTARREEQHEQDQNAWNMQKNAFKSAPNVKLASMAVWLCVVLSATHTNTHTHTHFHTHFHTFPHNNAKSEIKLHECNHNAQWKWG